MPPVVISLKPQPTVVCDHWKATLELSATATKLRVGDTVTLTLSLSNTTCGHIGQLAYRASVKTEDGQSIFEPSQSEHVVFGTQGTARPGGSVTEKLVLRAIKPGEAALDAHVSFESHEWDSGGAAYWGYGQSSPILIEVTR